MARNPDRLMQLTPRPMAEVAAGWTALEQAGGSRSAFHLMPVSADRHHVLLSGLNDWQVASLEASGFAPALVLHKSDGLHEVVLSTPNGNRPYEMAALAEASEDLRLRLGVSRNPYGLRIDDPDHPETAVRGGDGRTGRIYAQILTDSGGSCARLGRRLADWIGAFTRRFGLGAASRLGLKLDGAAQHAEAPVYWAHRGDLLARWQGRWPDPSRIDALIARRLRGTGHGEDVVAALITACAPLVPRIGRHAWTGYGRRAAAYAFRNDADERGWSLDRASTTMWQELEEVVRKREEALKPKPPVVPVLPVISPAEPPPRRKAGAATTDKSKRGGGRGDD